MSKPAGMEAKRHLYLDQALFPPGKLGIERDADLIEARASRPCGLCSTEGVLGVLVVPDSFVDPARVN